MMLAAPNGAVAEWVQVHCVDRDWPRAEITGDDNGKTVPKRGAAPICVAPIV